MARFRPSCLYVLACAVLLTACAANPTQRERELIDAWCGEAPIGLDETARAVEAAQRYEIDCDEWSAP